MVRRSRHLQRLGQHLAQRRLRYLLRNRLDRIALRQRHSFLQPLVDRAQLDRQAPASTTSPSSAAISTNPRNSTTTPTAKAVGFSTCSAINSATTPSGAASSTISKSIAAKMSSLPISSKPSKKPRTSTSIVSSSNGSTVPALQNSISPTPTTPKNTRSLSPSKQTQKVESHVGIFSAPVDVEITTASGPKLYTVNVTQSRRNLHLPSDSAAAHGPLRQRRLPPENRQFSQGKERVALPAQERHRTLRPRRRHDRPQQNQK